MTDKHELLDAIMYSASLLKEHIATKEYEEITLKRLKQIAEIVCEITSDGCEHCIPVEKISAIDVFDSDGIKTATICGPKFCPMCGKRLESEARP